MKAPCLYVSPYGPVFLNFVGPVPQAFIMAFTRVSKIKGPTTCILAAVALRVTPNAIARDNY